MSVLAAERRRVTVFAPPPIYSWSLRLFAHRIYPFHITDNTLAVSGRVDLVWVSDIRAAVVCARIIKASQPLDQILIQFTARFIRTISLCKINFNTAFANPPLFSKRLLNALQAVSTKIKRIVVSLV